MRSLLAFVLLPALLLQACASASAPPAAQGAPPPDFQAINEELEGDPATVELVGGEVVRKAESVVLGPRTCSFRDATGRERAVPTSQVLRLLHVPRHRAGKGFGYGALAAILPALLLSRRSSDHDGDPLAGLGPILVGIPVGGLIGMAVAIADRHPVVVYAAPVERNAAQAELSGAVRCRFAPPSARGPLTCFSAGR